MASRQDKYKTMSAPQVLLAVMASSASTEASLIPTTSEGSSPDPRVSTPLPPTPMPRSSTALSPIARPRNQSTPVSRTRERSLITCPKPKPSPIPRSSDLPSSSLSPEGQFVLDSNDEERLISDKENVCCISNIEASTSSVHLWRDVCNETGVAEDSEHAHQMVMAHIWQFQKKLLETQKESLSSLEELKASVGINGKRSRSKQIRASPETANLVHRGYKYYMEHHNMSPWNINEDPLGGSNGSISSKIMEYVRGANPNTSHEEVNAAIKTYWRNLRRKKKEENIWGDRQLEARRKKNKSDKYHRRLNAVPLLQVPEEDKVRLNNVLSTLRIDVSQSTEETGEEENPFEEGDRIKVKFVRRRRWESIKFQELKKKCDWLHHANMSRSRVQRITGAFSIRAKPDVPPECNWILQDSD